MPKPGIKIITEEPGFGPELKKGDRIRLRYDLHFNRGDCISVDQEIELIIGDRDMIAGLNYGLEGMRVGGTRRFKASPHLCYRDLKIPSIPKNAVLVFDIKCVQLVKSSKLE